MNVDTCGNCVNATSASTGGKAVWGREDCGASSGECGAYATAAAVRLTAFAQRENDAMLVAGNLMARELVKDQAECVPGHKITFRRFDLWFLAG